MPAARHTINRKLMALTRRYQRKFPETAGGAKQLGRISLKARADYVKAASNLIVKDPLIVEFAFDGLHDSKWGVEMISRHALQKAGNAESAVALLKGHINAIENARTPSGSFLGGDDVRKSGKIMRLSKEDYVRFSSETYHMLEPIWMLEAKMRLAIKELEKK